jgi:tetratricopeptide (TPR) repeat protein
LKVLISGQAGLAVIVDGDGVASIDVETRHRIARSPQEWPYMLSDANDVYELNDISDAEIVKELDLAWQKDRSLHLVLVLLDRDADKKARQESATYLDEFLADDQVFEHILNRLHVAPLPDVADLQGAIDIVKSRGNIRTGAILDQIAKGQQAIRRCRQAWDLLPADLFGSSNAKETFGFRAVEQGFFAAVSSGKEVHHAKFTEAGDHKIIKRWRREIKSIATLESHRSGFRKPVGNARPILAPMRAIRALSAHPLRLVAAAAAALILVAIAVRIQPVSAANLVRIGTGQPYEQVVLASRQGFQQELNGGLKQLIPLSLRSSSNKEAESLFALGETHTSAGRPQEAAVAFQQSNSSYPTFAAHLNEAVALLNSSQLARAEQILNSVLAGAKDSDAWIWRSAALTNLGNIYHTRGQLDRAEKVYSDALEIDRNNGFRVGEATNLSNLGLVLLDRGKHVKALENFKQALSIGEVEGKESVVANARLNIVVILTNFENFSEADQTLKSAAAYYERQGSPLDRAYYSSVSANYYLSERHQVDQGLIASRRALELYRAVGNKSGEALALIGLGVGQTTTSGSTAEAFDLYRQALFLSETIGDIPKQILAYGELGGWYAGAKEYEEAISNYRKALELSQPIGADAQRLMHLLAIANLMGPAGQGDEALTYFNKAVQLALEIDDPFAQGGTYLNLAIYLYWSLHQPKESLAALEKAHSFYSQIDSPLRDQTQSLIDKVRRMSSK